MMPGNPVVGGSILRRPAIESPDYVPGSEGWAINADGSASFADLTITGGSLTLEGPTGSPVVEIRPDLGAILVYSST